MTLKLDHLEGLRGICCAIVVIDHCFNHFGPWLRRNGSAEPLAQQLIANTPLNLIYSGIPAVYIFFLMSGFVLSLGFFRYKDQYLESALLKRIPRLVLPCIGAALFFFICHLIAKLAGGGIPGAKFIDLLLEATWRAPALGIVHHNGPLWTISWELYGSFLVFALLACFGRAKYFGLVCVAAIIWFFNTNYLPFIIGMATCYFTQRAAAFNRPLVSKPLNAAVFAGLLLLSLWLMSYPFQREGIVIPAHLSAISWSGEWTVDYRNNVMVGAILFYIAFMFWEPLRTKFTAPKLVFLGKISFSAYLIHIPIIWLTDMLFSRHLPDAHAGFLTSTAIVLALTLLCATMFERYVDRPAIALSSKIAKRVLQLDIKSHSMQTGPMGHATNNPLATSIPAVPSR